MLRIYHHDDSKVQVLNWKNGLDIFISAHLNITEECKNNTQECGTITGMMDPK